MDEKPLFAMPDLTGPQGNALWLLGHARRLLKEAGYPADRNRLVHGRCEVRRLRPPAGDHPYMVPCGGHPLRSRRGRGKLMFARINVDIVIDVDLETLTPSVEVDIQTDDPLPQEVVLAAVEGALNASLRQVQERRFELNPPESSRRDIKRKNKEEL